MRIGLIVRFSLIELSRICKQKEVYHHCYSYQGNCLDRNELTSDSTNIDTQETGCGLVAPHPKGGYQRNRKIGYISFVIGGSATPQCELITRYIEYTNTRPMGGMKIDTSTKVKLLLFYTLFMLLLWIH